MLAGFECEKNNDSAEYQTYVISNLIRFVSLVTNILVYTLWGTKYIVTPK